MTSRQMTFPAANTMMTQCSHRRRNTVSAASLRSFLDSGSDVMASWRQRVTGRSDSSPGEMGDTHTSLDPGLGQRDTGSLEDTDMNTRRNPRNDRIGDMRS